MPNPTPDLRDTTARILYELSLKHSGFRQDEAASDREWREAKELFARNPGLYTRPTQAFEAADAILAVVVPAVRERESDQFPHRNTGTRVYFYERDFYPLSNFSAFNLRWKGRLFPTSEHAYQWEKFPRNPEFQRAIELAPSAHEAFKIAERHQGWRRSDWEIVRVPIMREILTAKAEQHEYVRYKLRQANGREIAEDSWRDKFWGIGPDGDGQNMLGKLWMEVAAAIREMPDV